MTLRTHQPKLDGIRGLAILAVLLTHGSWLIHRTPTTKWLIHIMEAGWTGVDLFFVLSGFLITGILLQTRSAANRAISFYARRFLRIFPIYYLTLALIFVSAAIFYWPNTVLPAQPIARVSYFLYLQNLPIIGPAYPSYNILGHFWSLAVEEQFYLIWPVLIWFLPKRALLGVCIALCFASLGLSTGLVAHYGAQFWIAVMTPTRGIGLLVGSALAIVTAQWGRVPKSTATVMFAAGTGIVGFICIKNAAEFWNTEAGPYMWTVGTLGLALLSGALIAASQYEIPILDAFLRSRPLRQFGKYSYGIYVYHLPILVFANYVVGTYVPGGVPQSNITAVLYLLTLVAISFIVAWVSYSVIESRFLSMKRYFEPVYSEPSPSSELLKIAAL